MGILFALIALASWALGDFLIQRSVRKLGDWETLLYINLIAIIILFPFVYGELGALAANIPALLILILTSVGLLVAAILDFEALRVGKIAVIEGINALELPITMLFAAAIIHEYLTTAQYALVTALLIGIILVATKSFHRLKNAHRERGVWLAVGAMFAMGVQNFLFGVGARQTSPLMINWFTSLFLGIICLGYLMYTSRAKTITSDWRRNWRLLLPMIVADNGAWIAYSYATLTIPIAIAAGISESYIALAAMLGLLFNREKLKPHQLFGLTLCFISVVALSAVTDR